MQTVQIARHFYAAFLYYSPTSVDLVIRRAAKGVQMPFKSPNYRNIFEKMQHLKRWLEKPSKVGGYIRLKIPLPFFFLIYNG